MLSQLNSLLGTESIESSSRNGRKILWIARCCLLDSSSGASLAVREILVQLQRRGWQVQALGLTVLDAPQELQPIEAAFKNGVAHTWMHCKDGEGLRHALFRTLSHRSGYETVNELDALFRGYVKALQDFQPDIVFFMGGSTFDYVIASEGKSLGVPCVAYLANGFYVGDRRWFRDVDLVLTDSFATAKLDPNLAAKRPVVPVGCMVDKDKVCASVHTRKHVLFINPQPHKGAVLVAQLACLMAQRRPDIVFEVVETRGVWQPVLEAVSQAMGQPVSALPNVILTPLQIDMRPVYGRARMLLHPSLWWESAGRVIVEAALNGIPSMATDRGGQAEMLAGSGVLLRMPEAMYEVPYGRLLDPQELEPWIQQIELWFDDSVAYARAAQAALDAASAHHQLQTNINKVEAQLLALCRGT